MVGSAVSVEVHGTTEYIDRPKEEGLTKKEALRCLESDIAREICQPHDRLELDRPEEQQREPGTLPVGLEGANGSMSLAAIRTGQP